MRDKRGYETTYLMHWFREGARQRSRVLYMFRTPGGVRVGRLPLDRDILRLIEAQHPDIQFDWNAVRETQQVIEPAPDFRRRRPRREEGEAPPQHVPPPAAPPRPASVAPPPAPVVPRLQVPSVVEGNSPDEQIAFLLKWHPLICERLALRTADPERRNALLALAERLNPVSWTDAEQITAGLQQAADALERLSRVMARRRRRARKSATDRPATSDSPGTSDSEGTSDADAAFPEDRTESSDGTADSSDDASES